MLDFVLLERVFRRNDDDNFCVWINTNATTTIRIALADYMLLSQAFSPNLQTSFSTTRLIPALFALYNKTSMATNPNWKPPFGKYDYGKLFTMKIVTSLISDGTSHFVYKVLHTYHFTNI